MTDHKAFIKIEFSIYGQTDIMDAWINWSPHDSACFPIDQRVINFFEAHYEKARATYDDRTMEWEQQQRQESAEREERETLARLKAKYEPDQPAGDESV